MGYVQKEVKTPKRVTEGPFWTGLRPEAKPRAPGRGCQTGERVCAETLRWEVSFAQAAFWKAKLEHLLLCLQRVNSSHIVAWDVTFLLCSQGPCLPPLPSPKENEGEEGERISRHRNLLQPDAPLPPPGPRSSPSHPQEARRERGEVPSMCWGVSTGVWTETTVWVFGSILFPGLVSLAGLPDPIQDPCPGSTHTGPAAALKRRPRAQEFGYT